MTLVLLNCKYWYLRIQSCLFLLSCWLAEIISIIYLFIFLTLPFFPAECNLRLYGSCLTRFAFKTSDVNIDVTYPSGVSLFFFFNHVFVVVALGTPIVLPYALFQKPAYFSELEFFLNCCLETDISWIKILTCWCQPAACYCISLS